MWEPQFRKKCNESNWFFDRLPLEVPWMVFTTYFSQSELVDAGIVCQKWFKLIPNITRKTNWTRLVVSPDSPWRTPCMGLRKNLTPVMSTVSIRHMRNASSILKELSIEGCNIETLELQNITAISDSDGFIPRFYKTIGLFDSISLFGQSLKTLRICNYLSDFPVCRLLQKLPLLAHCTLLFARQKAPKMVDEQHNGLSRNEVFHNLIYLHLDSYHSCTYLSLTKRLMPLLRRCPNLRWLITSTIEQELAPCIFRHDIIFNTCRKLEYVAWNVPRWMYDKRYCQNEHKQFLCNESFIKEKYTSLERRLESTRDALTIYGRYDSPSGIQNIWIGKILRDHCQSIRHLEISICDMDSALMKTINERLTYASKKDIRFLKLQDFGYHLREYVNFDFSALRLFRDLRHLCLKNIVISKQGLFQIPELEALEKFHAHFDRSTVLGEPFDQISLLFFANRIRNNSTTLQTLTLTGINEVTDQFLEIVSHTKSLSLVRISDSANTTENGRAVFTNAGTADHPKRVELLRHSLYTI